MLEVWLSRDLAAKAETESTAAATSQAEVNMGVKSSFVSDCDTVHTSGNKEYISSGDYQSAEYQNADYQNEGATSPLEQLVEAFEFVKSADEFAAVIEGSLLETVEDAIALSGNQPRRQQLRSWLAAVQKPVEPSLGFKIGDCLKQIKGAFSGRIARVVEIFDWGIKTSLGDIDFSEMSGWERG